MTRGSLGSLGLVVAGLVLGGYVLASWPDAAPRPPSPSSQPVRATASAGADAESELAGLAGAFYPGELFAYELGPTPYLEAIIAAPAAVEAQ